MSIQRTEILDVVPRSQAVRERLGRLLRELRLLRQQLRVSQRVQQHSLDEAVSGASAAIAHTEGAANE